MTKYLLSRSKNLTIDEIKNQLSDKCSFVQISKNGNVYNLTKIKTNSPYKIYKVTNDGLCAEIKQNGKIETGEHIIIVDEQIDEGSAYTKYVQNPAPKNALILTIFQELFINNPNIIIGINNIELDIKVQNLIGKDVAEEYIAIRDKEENSKKEVVTISDSIAKDLADMVELEKTTDPKEEKYYRELVEIIREAFTTIKAKNLSGDENYAINLKLTKDGKAIETVQDFTNFIISLYPNQDHKGLEIIHDFKYKKPKLFFQKFLFEFNRLRTIASFNQERLDESIILEEHRKLEEEDLKSYNHENISIAEAQNTRDEFEDAFLICDLPLIGMQIPKIFQDSLRSIGEEIRNSDMVSGSTLTMAHFDGQKLRLANIGDSRAVLWSKDNDGNLSPIRLTLDHDLNDLEVKIVESRGAYIDTYFKGLTGKLDNMMHYISVPRSFGDNFLQSTNLFEPDLYEYNLTSENIDDLYLMLSCDGVYDRNGSCEHNFTKIIRDHVNDPNIASKIIDTAAQIGSSDNLTCIFVPLKSLKDKLCVVLDGHGGKEVAHFVRDNLPSYIEKAAKELTPAPQITPSKHKIPGIIFTALGLIGGVAALSLFLLSIPMVSISIFVPSALSLILGSAILIVDAKENTNPIAQNLQKQQPIKSDIHEPKRETSHEILI